MSKIILTEKDTYDFYKGFLKSFDYLIDDCNPGNSFIKDGSSYYYSFSEIYEDFMSPCELVITWHVLSDAQRKNLQKLCDILEDYEDWGKTDDEIREDPKWQEIREFGKIVYQDMKNVKYIPEGK